MVVLAAFARLVLRRGQGERGGGREGLGHGTTMVLGGGGRSKREAAWARVGLPASRQAQAVTIRWEYTRGLRW